MAAINTQIFDITPYIAADYMNDLVQVFDIILQRTNQEWREGLELTQAKELVTSWITSYGYNKYPTLLSFANELKEKHDKNWSVAPSLQFINGDLTSWKDIFLTWLIQTAPDVYLNVKEQPEKINLFLQHFLVHVEPILQEKCGMMFSWLAHTFPNINEGIETITNIIKQVLQDNSITHILARSFSAPLLWQDNYPLYSRDVDFFSDLLSSRLLFGEYSDKLLGGVFWTNKVGEMMPSLIKMGDLGKFFWVHNIESFSENGEMGYAEHLENMIDKSYVLFRILSKQEIAAQNQIIQSFKDKYVNAENSLAVIDSVDMEHYQTAVYHYAIAQNAVVEILSLYSSFKNCVTNVRGLYDAFCAYNTAEVANKLFSYLTSYYFQKFNIEELLKVSTYNSIEESVQVDLQQGNEGVLISEATTLDL